SGDSKATYRALVHDRLGQSERVGPAEVDVRNLVRRRPAIRDPEYEVAAGANGAGKGEAHLRAAAVTRGGYVVGADDGLSSRVEPDCARVAGAVARKVVLHPHVARAPVDDGGGDVDYGDWEKRYSRQLALRRVRRCDTHPGQRRHRSADRDVLLHDCP